jgi:hypothetical protein
MASNYKAFIEENFKIIDKSQREVSFNLNVIQDRFLIQDSTGKDVILKARQQGFSSLILALFTTDFLLKENTRSVIVADISDNATELLDRVKYFIKTYEEINRVKIPLKYNSKYELFNEDKNSRYTIGTADNAEFGRSKTITNLHLSEAAFYSNLTKIMAGAGTAVVPDGRFIIETTANGFNEFKTFWDDLQMNGGSFKPLFYKASDFYDAEFLAKEKLRLKHLFPQEYPETAEEAFLTSGDLFFDPIALKSYLINAKEPIKEGMIYV